MVAHEIDLTLLTGYLAGECAPAECARVEAWAAADPRHATELAELRGLMSRAARVAPGGFDTLAGWRAVRARSRDVAPGGAPKAWPRGVGGGAGVRIQWGASAVIAAVVIGAAVSVASRMGARTSRQVFRELATSAGSRSTVTLRDGTQLVLGPATRLRVPTDFGDTSRVVELEGEAAFHVVHDDARPFAVHTVRAIVRDVGTTFVMRAYAADREDRVAVSEGAIAIETARVSNGADSHVVAGSLARVTADGRVTVRTGADLTSELAWVQGGLVFNDTPLGDAASDIARTYGLTITIADSTLVTKLITASFGDEPSNQVLDAVTLMIGAGYERTGNHVVIRRWPVGTRHPGAGGSSPTIMSTARGMRSNTPSSHN